MLVKTGPLEKVKCRFPCSSSLSKVVPVISVGIKSGVNCTRVKSRDMVSARLLIISVFANPGTPSITTCPLAKNAVRIWPMTSTWPTMIFPTSAAINSPDFASLAMASAWLPHLSYLMLS